MGELDIEPFRGALSPHLEGVVLESLLEMHELKAGAVLLRHVWGLDHTQIAQYLDVTDDYARQLCIQGIRELKARTFQN